MGYDLNLVESFIVVAGWMHLDLCSSYEEDFLITLMQPAFFLLSSLFLRLFAR